MKLTLLLSCILTTVIKSHAIECDTCLDGWCYKKDMIFERQEVSGQLAIDRIRNVLYFHFEDSSKVDFCGAFNLDNMQLQIIPGINFTFARAVDQKTYDVYMSGTQGVYKYNPNTGLSRYYDLYDKTIWHMQYKNRLYYVEFLSTGIYTYENNKSDRISATANYQIDEFIIDKNDDVYFKSKSAVYRLRKGSGTATLFAEGTYTLTVDRKSNAYFIQPVTRAIYRLNYETDQMTKVGAFGGGIASKVVFDSDNDIIYHDTLYKKLFYLTINKNHCSISDWQAN